jgi:hypothetical protein
MKQGTETPCDQSRKNREHGKETTKAILVVQPLVSPGGNNSRRKGMNNPTAKQIDAILKHLAVLKNPDVPISTWHSGKTDDGAFLVPTEEHSSEIEALIADLNKYQFVRSFDWPSWHRSAVKYVENNSGAVQRANLGTLVKLLTLHVRKDRFSEGHFSAMVRSGHIRAILERLAVLRRNSDE